MLSRLPVAVLLLLVSGCVVAPGPYPPAHVRDDVHVVAPPPGASVTLVFSNRDRLAIADYYRLHTPPGLERKGKLPPGLAKKGKLPPGHVKRLERHQYLERHRVYQPLPRDLQMRLAPLPDGYIHVRVDDDIAILELRTRMILDVVYPF